MTSLVTDSASIASRLIASFADWLWRGHDCADVRSMSASEVESIAHDLRISRAELEVLVVHNHQAANELPQCSRASGLTSVRSRARSRVCCAT
ncbi:hypothetical protein SAMN05216525_15538 [Bradyrhizobium sp. Gha]|nr:hypothetical protein SAMN05216525_15538 [Bradyrhizobium sp. Gha]